MTNIAKVPVKPERFIKAKCSVEKRDINAKKTWWEHNVQGAGRSVVLTATTVFNVYVFSTQWCSMIRDI